jgi:hypothetical protein
MKYYKFVLAFFTLYFMVSSVAGIASIQLSGAWNADGSVNIFFM